MQTMYFGSDMKPFAMPGRLVDDFGHERVIEIRDTPLFTYANRLEFNNHAALVKPATFVHTLRPLSDE